MRKKSILLLAGLFFSTASLMAQVFSQPIRFSSTTVDKISLFGDRFGDSNMYGFGVESNTLYYKAAGNHRWYLNKNANGGGNASMALTNSGLGIGTSSPNHELVVQGNDPVFQIRDDASDNSTNAARIELLERAGGNFNGGAFIWWNGSSNKLLFGTKNGGTNQNVMVINRSGSNVGIGTINPSSSYKLSVNGKIRAKEIVVDAGWSDFVFNHDYNLRSLKDVEQFIGDNGHLPEIPSAEEVECNGVTVGEMESKLLMKIEELTLYIIEQNKRIVALEKK